MNVFDVHFFSKLLGWLQTEEYTNRYNFLMSIKESQQRDNQHLPASGASATVGEKAKPSTGRGVGGDVSFESVGSLIFEYLSPHS